MPPTPSDTPPPAPAAAASRAEPTDEQLVGVIHRGGPDAPRHFEVLYRRHRDWVYRLALRFTPGHDDALDVTQEVFIYLLRKLDPAGPGFTLTSKLTTFLYPAVKHIALARRRRKVPRPVEEQTLEAARVPDPPPERTDLSELAGVLRGLSDVHREAILLRFVDGMSMEEMSAALDVPVGTIKSRLHNAIAALREDPRTQAYFLGERQ